MDDILPDKKNIEKNIGIEITKLIGVGLLILSLYLLGFYTGAGVLAFLLAVKLLSD
jgi:hypothetical protein